MTRQKQTEEVVRIALNDLIADENNRKVGGFDPTKLKQLAESIKAVGIQQPVIVRWIQPASKYEIVAGERRWRAAEIAGLKTLPCVVRDLDGVTVLKIRTIENLQREDIHPLDEAAGYARLIEKAGYDADHVAQEVGKSISYVYQRIKLLELIAPVREMLVKGTINAGHAILIARLQPDQQKDVANSYLFRGEEAPSVRDLDSHIRGHILMDLGKTYFQKDDPDLVAKAGPCTTCQKRTGSQPELFADVCKKDYCTDRGCFQAKLNALIVRRQAELAGEKHLLVREGYGSEKDLPGFIKGALEHYDWQECKAKDNGAIRCLVVDGVSRGRLAWGKKSEHGHYQPSSQEKAAAERERRKLQIKRDVRLHLYKAVIGELGIDEKKLLRVDLLRVIASYAWGRLMDNHKVLLAKVEGWENPKKKQGVYGNGRRDQGNAIIAKLNLPELLLFMVKVSLIGVLDVQQYYYAYDAAKTLNGIAEILGIDVKANEAAMRKQAVNAVKAKAKKTAKKSADKKRS